MQTPNFIFKSGVRTPAGADPNVVGAELERIRDAHGGSLTAEVVLNAAKDERSPLHSWFEWDDSEAARQHRLNQARGLIRSVAVRFIEPDASGAPKAREIRAFVSTSTGGSPGVYRRVEDAIDDPVLRKQLVERLLSKLRSLKLEFGTLSSYIKVRRQLDGIIDEIEADEAERQRDAG